MARLIFYLSLIFYLLAFHIVTLIFQYYRQALVPPPSDEKVVEEPVPLPAGTSRLWTAADFASASNSPEIEYSLSSHVQTSTYSPMENMQGSSEMSPAAPAQILQPMHVTPENVRQFRQMAQEM